MGSRSDNERRNKRHLDDSSTSGSCLDESMYMPKVPGRLISLELEDFMCHAHMRLAFDAGKCNCFYIVGPNGSGKSAIFAGLNIGLGGRGRANDRGDNVQSYIREGKSCARVRIVMSNEGPNRHPDYGKEIIIERMIASSKSVFTLKSRNGRGGEQIISRRKVDLDSLLQHFSIELENPLSWLSQDRSRQFLQDMKPEKLYEMFMITTQLETTEHLYTDIGKYIDEGRTCLAQCGERKERMKKEYEDMIAMHRVAKRVQEIKRELDQFSWMLLWAPIRDIDQRCEEERGKLTKLAEVRAKFEAQLRKEEENEIEINSRREKFAVEARSLKDETTAQHREHAKVKERLNQLARHIGECQHKIKRKHQDVETATQDIKVAEGQLSRVVGGGTASGRNLADEEAQTSAERDDLLGKLTELDGQLNEAKEVEKQREEDAGNIRNRLHNVSYTVNRLQSKLEEVEKEERMWTGAKRNRLNVFGMEIPRVVELIEANAARFRVKPLGPIGSFIKLHQREMKWASAVEFAVRKLASNFICDSAEDRRTLEQLCKSNGLRPPSMTVTKFMRERFHTARNEPPQNFATILRVIDVSDPTVFNVLVDNAQIENRLLVEGSDEARALMKNPPRNAREAVTAECCQAYASDGTRPYRFFYNRALNAKYLVENSVDSRRNFRVEMQEVRREIEQNQRTAKEQEAERQNAEDHIKTARDALTRLRQKKSKIEESLRNVEKRLEEILKILSSGDLIQSLSEAVEEGRRVRQAAVEEADKLKTELENLEERKLAVEIEETSMQDKRKAALDQLRSIEENVHRCTKQQTENQEQIRSIKEKISKCDRLKKNSNDTIDTFAEERQKKQLRCNKDKKDFMPPPHLDDPPDFTKLPATVDLMEEYKRLEGMVQMEEERSLNQREPPTVESIKAFTDRYKAFNHRFKYFTSIFGRFNELVDSQFKRYNILKFALPLELSKEFERQMSTRQYVGSLRVDHDSRMISVSVETHKRTDLPAGASGINMSSMQTALRSSSRGGTAHSPALAQKKRMVQDLKGLSGGERSYTTACFVMALWKCVNSPFRCLDEFDIFMDNYNRRRVIDMLMEMAEKSKDTQFFFFTPQGVSELKNNDNIQVFTLTKEARKETD